MSRATRHRARAPSADRSASPAVVEHRHQVADPEGMLVGEDLLRMGPVCERCVPVLREHLGGARASEWQTYVEAWRVHESCLGRDE